MSRRDDQRLADILAAAALQPPTTSADDDRLAQAELAWASDELAARTTAVFAAPSAFTWLG